LFAGYVAGPDFELGCCIPGEIRLIRYLVLNSAALFNQPILTGAKYLDWDIICDFIYAQLAALALAKNVSQAEPAAVPLLKNPGINPLQTDSHPPSTF